MKAGKVDTKEAPKTDKTKSGKDAKSAPKDAKTAPKDTKAASKDAKAGSKDAKAAPKDAKVAPKAAKDGSQGGKDKSNKTKDSGKASKAANNAQKTDTLSEDKDPIKLLRNSRKKLKEIARLEAKIQSNEITTPTQEQLDKMNKKEQFQKRAKEYEDLARKAGRGEEVDKLDVQVSPSMTVDLCIFPSNYFLTDKDMNDFYAIYIYKCDCANGELQCYKMTDVSIFLQ